MTVKQVDETLRGLPLDDRIGALIVNLCENRVDSIAAIGGLISAAGILGSNLPNEVDRRRCSTAIREVATEIEADHIPLLPKERMKDVSVKRR
jgi:hypothetical protein